MIRELQTVAKSESTHARHQYNKDVVTEPGTAFSHNVPAEPIIRTPVFGGRLAEEAKAAGNKFRLATTREGSVGRLCESSWCELVQRFATIGWTMNGYRK